MQTRVIPGVKLIYNSKRKMVFFMLLRLSNIEIAAIPYESVEGTNSNNNHLESGWKNLNRTKRSTSNWLTISGDQYSFNLNEPDSKILILATIFDFAPTYHYNKFYITRDLNFTTWNEFLSVYKWADFNERIHIKFSRADKNGRSVDVRLIPSPIKLRKIRTIDIDVEKWYDFNPTFYVHTNPVTVKKAMVMSVKDIPFDNYDEKIFDESIWVGAARVNAKIHISLEGFKKNNELILQMIFKFSHSCLFTTSGIDCKMNGYNEIVLR